MKTPFISSSSFCAFLTVVKSGYSVWYTHIKVYKMDIIFFTCKLIIVFYIQIKTNRKLWDNSKVSCNIDTFKILKISCIETSRKHFANQILHGAWSKSQKSIFLASQIWVTAYYNTKTQVNNIFGRYFPKILIQASQKQNPNELEGGKLPTTQLQQKTETTCYIVSRTFLSTTKRKRKSSIKKIKKGRDSVFWAAQFVVCLPRG